MFKKYFSNLIFLQFSCVLFFFIFSNPIFSQNVFIIIFLFTFLLKFLFMYIIFVNLVFSPFAHSCKCSNAVILCFALPQGWRCGSGSVLSVFPGDDDDDEEFSGLCWR